MNILHLTLGIPEYRSGGLINYSYEVAQSQSKAGHNVYILYPGNVRLTNRETRICRVRNRERTTDLHIYKIVNPQYVPVPLGVGEPQKVMGIYKGHMYQDFISKVKPDLVHIHSFMGFHETLFALLKKENIKMLYTSHDYYVICPRTSFVNSQNQLCCGSDPVQCAICNAGVVNSDFMQYVLQSEWYPKLKNSKIMRILKRNRRSNQNKPVYKTDINPLSEDTILEYEKLLNYLRRLVHYVDCIHFNSSVAYGYYEREINLNNYFIEPITTGGLIDNRGKENSRGYYDGTGCLRLGFIGIRDYHKGYQILLKAGKMLYDKGYKIEIMFYGDEYHIDRTKYPFCVEKGRFPHRRIADVMRGLDLLVIPSVWGETFGFTAIEAAVNNVPALISSHVGAKDVFKSVKTPHEFEPSAGELANLILKYLNQPELILRAVAEQKKLNLTLSIDEHAERLLDKARASLSMQK